MTKTEELINKTIDKNSAYKIYKKVADLFLDKMCELDGVNETIKYLIDMGFKDNDLLFLLFSKEDIKKAHEDLKTDWKYK